MSTVTATGWSGLVNDVHGTTYSTVGEIPPKDGAAHRLMQKRGDLGVAEVAGGVTQRSRAVIDANDGDSDVDTGYHGGTTWVAVEGLPNDPGSTGQGAVDRIDIPKKMGGDRGITLVNVVPDIDATGLGQIFDTTITHAYVADDSGNGGAAMAAHAPNATQP